MITFNSLSTLLFGNVESDYLSSLSESSYFLVCFYCTYIYTNDCNNFYFIFTRVRIGP
jgi:hypothetical protein